jgi:hypothetical protein
MNHWGSIQRHLDENSVDESLVGLETAIDAKIFNIPPEFTHEFFLEIPNIVYRFILQRDSIKNRLDELSTDSEVEFRKLIEKFSLFDRKEELKKIIFTARTQYKEEYDEDISLHKMKSLFQYLRNLTISRHRLFPSLFTTILAGKSIIGDDFAWILFEECKRFTSAVDEDSQYENIEIDGNRLRIGNEFFFLRKYKPNYGEIDKSMKIPLKKRPSKKEMEKWKESFKYSYGAVSYPPEDIFEENFFRYVRTRSLQVFQEFYSKTHEFTSTLMDGINFRETIRNWPTKKKIYVDENVPLKGDVDAVVFIFSENEFGKPTKYENRWMFYGEHDEESDLGLYSTYPGELIVGPGISRIEIGGISSFFPRGHVKDVWSAPVTRKYLRSLKSDAEILLLGSIHYGEKKFIAYVAEKKPRPIMYDLASRYQKSIIYLPLSRFNSTTISSVRNLHILKDKNIRKFAGEYIKKRRY